MSQLEYHTITLPSRGVLYGESIPEGEVEIRRMRARELALLSEGGAIMDRVEKLAAACTRLPNDFPQTELLSTDRMYLLLAIRTMTFGPVYRFEYRCDACGTSTHHDVNISEELEMQPGGVEMPDGERILAEPLVVELPDMGCKVGLRYMRGKDEQAMVRHRKRTKAQGSAAVEPAELYRYTRLLLSKDGEDLDAPSVRRVVDNLSARDLMTLNKRLSETEPGVDLTVYPVCDACGADNELSLPFTAEFFRPDTVF